MIEYIEEAEQGLYVLLSDFAPYLLEYGASKPELVRRLRELAWAIRSRPVTVISFEEALLEQLQGLQAVGGRSHGVAARFEIAG